MDTRFHCVYLLTSLDPNCAGLYYIGYTVNPLRRLRQHNGELVNGARQTSRRGRPWTLVCCVSGFTEDRAALKFEWCWQNPTVSARLKHTVGVLKGLRRLPFAVGTLHLLVRAPLFSQLDLTLHVFEPVLLSRAAAQAEAFLASSPHVAAVAAAPSSLSQGGSASRRGDGGVGGGGGEDSNSGAPPLHPSTLPPLTPSLLFHVEETTRHAFEDAHLSHDRCLLLPSGGGEESGASGAGSPGGYDLSFLSQAAREEWTHARFASESDRGDTVDDASRVLGLVGCASSSASSRAPLPQRVRLETSPPPQVCHRSDVRAQGRHDEDAAGRWLRWGSTSRDHSIANLVADPAHAAPLDPAASCRVPPGSPMRALTSRSASPSSTGAVVAPSAASPPPERCAAPPHAVLPSGPSDAVAAPAAAPAPPPPPRIPLRFAAFTEADFARAHAAEQHRLHHGLLPCSLCALPLRPPCVAHCTRTPLCGLRSHLSCLAMWMLYAEAETAATTDTSTASAVQGALRRLIPTQPCPCPLCGVILHWGTIVKELKKRVVVEERLHAAQRRRRMEQQWQARLARFHPSTARQRAHHQHHQMRRPARVVTGTDAAPRGVPTYSAADAASVVDSSSPTAVTACPSPPSLASATSPTTSACSPIPSNGAAPQRRGAPALTAGAASAVADASFLSLTDFREDDWLLQ